MKADFLLDSLEYVGDDLIYETRNDASHENVKRKRRGGFLPSKRARIIALVAVIAVVASLLSGLFASGMIAKVSWSQNLKNMKDVMEYGYLASIAERAQNVELSDLTEYDREYDTGFYVMVLNRNQGNSKVTTVPFTDNTLAAMNRYHPVERLGFIDDDNIYVVYKIVTDSGAWTYVYILFHREEIYMDIYEDYRMKTVIRTDRCEKWVTNTEMYFLTETLSSSDFADISAGQSARAICDIDRNFAIEFEYGGLNYTGIDDSFGEWADVCYRWYKPLTDCVIAVDFVKSVKNKKPINISSYDPNELVISGVTYIPYGDGSNWNFCPYYDDDNAKVTVINAPNLIYDLIDSK